MCGLCRVPEESINGDVILSEKYTSPKNIQQISSKHGPFPAYLKRFHLSDSDYCSCGGIGTALHYATECIYTVSWHMRKPEPNFEQEWLKRVANNLVSRQKIRGSSNSLAKTEIFSGLPSLQHPSELN
ncbi:hypothetical protein AVEN_185432-1 [Araneus ventricosus]|uniref:Uncharacterized protein n=1 Tax=Araneus ventricosus TaxID=182803 RepID=A0A4Y2CID0_ARAVE|nr:hypothetical protein AVEN_185432-1 [Araneus ventricosus]